MAYSGENIELDSISIDELYIIALNIELDSISIEANMESFKSVEFLAIELEYAPVLSFPQIVRRRFMIIS